MQLVTAHLRAPFVSARDSVQVRRLVCVRVTDSRGRSGYGEAAPLHHYDGVGIEDVRSALEACRGLLAASDGNDRAELLRACAGETKLPQATAAIDLALWDLVGRREGQPVWRLLGAESAEPVEVNATISSPDRAGAAAAAASARAAGFGCVKVKVALGDDAGRLAAVRAAAGPEVAIRLDANGAWSIEEALASLRGFGAVRLELCEEPVSGVVASARLFAQAPVPIALDESGSEPGALDQRVADAVCLKIGRCGGITGLLAAASRARAAGYRLYLASTLDGPLGIAAALHAATVVRPDYPCGLATVGLVEGRDDPLPARGGRIAMPQGPGLGAGLLDWYRLRRLS